MRLFFRWCLFTIGLWFWSASAQILHAVIRRELPDFGWLVAVYAIGGVLLMWNAEWLTKERS